MWRPELVPTSVTLEAAPEGFAESVDLDPLAIGPVRVDRLGEDGRHVVIEDAAGGHQLWLRDATPGQPLVAVIPLDRDFHTRMASLARFQRRLFGRPPGPMPRSWVLTSYRRQRLELMLRVLDLHLAGYNYREIAIQLGEPDADEMSSAEWKGSRERAFVIRLVASANAMMNGGYRRFLRGR